MTKRIVSAALSLLILWAVESWSQSLEIVDWSKEEIFTEYPHLVGFQDGSALLQFATLRPMVATVHYGGYPADQDLCLPLFRFRTKANKLDVGQGYQAELKVYRFEYDTYNMAKGSSLEGVVVYRLGVMDEEDGQVSYYESRFRCGKADGQDWELRPCIIEGPFVDLITDRTAIISLEVDSLCYARIRLGDRMVVSLDDQGQAIRDRHHEMAIEDLDPVTSYRYQVEIAGDPDFKVHPMAWPEQTFQTAPKPGSQAPFSFVYMSDSRQCPGGGEYGFGGCNYRVAQQFMVDLYRQGVDMVLFGGDLVNGYTSSKESYLRQLRTWKKAVEPVGSHIPIYEGMGNHEQVGDYLKVDRPNQKSLTVYANRSGDESGEALFASQFVNPPGSCYGFGPPQPEDQWVGVGKELKSALEPLGLPQAKGPPYDETVYSFNYGNIHVISFNTNYWHTGVYYGSADEVNQAVQIVGGNREGYVMKRQLAWLKRDLEAAQQDDDVDWMVLFAHEPAFPNGGHLGDAMFWGSRGKGHLGGLNDPTVPSGDVIDMRNRFWGLVSSYSKTLAVFFGDEHNYSRTFIDGSVHSDYQYPVWQIVSGGAGAPFYGQDTSPPWTGQVKHFTSVPHYCLVMVHGKEVHLEVWDRSGRLVERVVLSDLPR